MPHALIPPSVRLDHLQPDPAKVMEAAGTLERPLRVLSVGRLTWVKGYEYGLQAIKLLKEQGIACEYRIVGDGDLLEGVSFARHQLELESIVQLLGPQPWGEVKNAMQWADVFLQASVQEGFCNAVIEAQAMKLPVVCSDAGGLPENVEHGVTGFVVPRRNPQALADKLRLLANDPELRDSMGKAGRERVELHFQLPTQIERFDQFYQNLFTHAR
jgi:colanic acid/amylovoran biosynthesis glycosyltransferase